MRQLPALLLAAALGLVLSGCQTQGVKQQPISNTGAEPVSSAQRDAVSDRTPQATDIWQLTRQHFQLPLDEHRPRVESQLNWYLRHRSHMTQVTRQARPYYHYVLHEVLKREMPAEIALLPIVESAYDPFAYSSGHAAGPWQFIPGTARHFGLRSSWWYDGRRDILASTNAALTYLEQLHRRFDGDWLLALAAYNAGGGTVSRAIKRNQKQGKPTDFWSLQLPRETRVYVPRLLAVARLVRDADALGISLSPIENRPYFEVVETGSQIDLAQVASLAGLKLEQLRQLNPGFNRWATDPEGPHRLLIPRAQAPRLREALRSLPPEKRLNWQRYAVRQGDTLGTIAQRFNTTVNAIRRSNRLNSTLIRIGQTLLIPQQATRSQLAQGSAAEPGAQVERRHYHRVSRGESFWSIARRYGIGVQDLARWNNMTADDKLHVGQQLLLLNVNIADAS